MCDSKTGSCYFCAPTKNYPSFFLQSWLVPQSRQQDRETLACRNDTAKPRDFPFLPESPLKDLCTKPHPDQDGEFRNVLFGEESWTKFEIVGLAACGPYGSTCFFLRLRVGQALSFAWSCCDRSCLPNKRPCAGLRRVKSTGLSTRHGESRKS